jgi:glycosyltransferase involved in cell wall biosynthesis
VALFLCPSEFVRARMVEWGFDPQTVAVVRNFTELRGAGGEPGEAGLYLGRLSAEKGVDVLLHALALAGDPPFRIAGDGPTMEALGALARRLELRRVEFVGHVDASAVPDLLEGSRYLAVPSLWDENAPIAALEAMTAGRPLIVAATGGLPELVRNGEGLTFPPGDAAALAARIRTFTDDAAACGAAAECALTRARAEFTPERHLERLESAYASVLAGRPAEPR